MRIGRGFAARRCAESGAIQATLDALLQLGHPVEAANQLPFQKQWPAEVVTMLAEDPQVNCEALLEMARKVNQFRRSSHSLGNKKTTPMCGYCKEGKQASF